jgi:flavin reductase ActVB
MSAEPVGAGDFRDAMSMVAAPLAIVATRDVDGMPWGFTASSVTSVSLDPPLVLVCVSHTSSCHGAMTKAEGFTVNFLSQRHRALARIFATTGADRFAAGEFENWEDSGQPFLPDARVSMRCIAAGLTTAGDHDVLFGLPTGIRVGAADSSGGCRCGGSPNGTGVCAAAPLLWHRRGFYPGGS